MSIGEVLLAVITGLVANECCALAPWCARKLVRWSARRQYTDPARAEARAEEWAALIDSRPGNLFKLITALAFTCSVALGAVRRHLARLLERAEGHQQRMRVIKITVTNGTGHPVTFSADLHDLILGNGNSLTVEFPSESLVQELHSKFSACLEERAHPRSIRRNPWRVPGRGK
jgi:hypothetical protein